MSLLTTDYVNEDGKRSIEGYEVSTERKTGSSYSSNKGGVPGGRTIRKTDLRMRGLERSTDRERVISIQYKYTIGFVGEKSL